MKNHFKKFLCVLVAVGLLCLVAGCGGEVDPYAQPTEKFFVNDFAELLDDTTEQTIVSLGAALQEATKAQLVAVTVATLDGQEAADFALELGRKWGVGDKELDNGIVLLLAEEEREIYVAVGYGLEGALPDSKTGRMIDYYALEDFKNDRFSAGMTALYRALVNETYLEYGLEPEEGYVAADQLQPKSENEDWGAVVVAWIILLVLVAVLGAASSRKSFLGGMFYGSVMRGGFSGSHRGGFGGGSGGFGGFSGGGGSFGGGGAGRGF